MKEKTNRKKAVSPEFIKGAANYKRSFMGKGRYVHEATTTIKNTAKTTKGCSASSFNKTLESY
jgi:hypothetical protein